jgi:hypothetical protein
VASNTKKAAGSGATEAGEKDPLLDDDDDNTWEKVPKKGRGRLVKKSSSAVDNTSTAAVAGK